MPIAAQRDPDQIRTALAAWLSVRLDHQVTVSTLSRPVATGYSNDTLLFDATWMTAGQTYVEAMVARIEPDGWAIFPDVDVGRQYDVMAAVAANCDAPLPALIGREDDPAVMGAPFFVMEKVSGAVPGDSPPYHMAGWVTEISSAERERMWWSAVEAMAEIHTIEPWSAQLGFLDVEADGAPGLDQRLTYYRRYLEWALDGGEHPVARAGLDWLATHQPDHEDVGLLWGDARIGNMIFSEGECRAVLDWEMATLADPQADLAWFLFLDRHHSAGIGVARLDGFGDPNDTVRRWEQLTGRTADQLPYYEVFAATRFSVIMVQVARMNIAYGVLPADSDLAVNNPCAGMLAELLE